MDYITKIETILICNNFRPNGKPGEIGLARVAWQEPLRAIQAQLSRPWKILRIQGGWTNGGPSNILLCCSRDASDLQVHWSWMPTIRKSRMKQFGNENGGDQAHEAWGFSQRA